MWWKERTNAGQVVVGPAHTHHAIVSPLLLLSLSLSLCVYVSVCLSYVSNYLDLLLYNPEVSPGEERRQLSEALQVRF